MSRRFQENTQMGEKETRDKSLKKLKVRKPLIPESVLDADSQKYYVLSLFILLQAWKIYDLFLLQKNNDSQNFSIDINDYSSGFFPTRILNPKLSFVFKYFFFDSLIILLIPFLNIPKLSFSPSFSLVSLIIINLITLSMTFASSIAITSVFYSFYKTIIPQKELTIMENYVDTESIINQSEHFKGRKTIRYAPDSSIRINPYNQQFCVRPVYEDKIKIPIKIDSIYSRDYLQLSYQDFNNDIMLFNFTSRDLKKFVVTDYYNSPYSKLDPSVLADSNVQLLEIPVDRPGYYSIKMATDGKEKQIRSYKSNTIISICPEAYFSQTPSFSFDKCIEEEVNDFEITVLGAPPFTLYYEEEINGKLSKLPPTTVFNSEKIDSPLNIKDASTKHNFAATYLKDLEWAKSYNISVPIMKTKLHTEGSYIYTINKIVDGFGNTVNYTPDPKDKATFVSFVSHPKPVLSLVDNASNVPILVDNEKYLNLKISNAQNAAKEGPFDVKIKFIPENNDNSNEYETIHKVFDLSKSNDLKIRAEKPGSYVIIDGSSKFCECKINSNSVNVVSAKVPKMDVTLDPIVDNCVGTTGFKFNFDFVGNAPFEITYRISRLDPNDSQKVLRVEKTVTLKSDSSTYEYDFKPSSEGSYSIELISLSDRFYKNKVKYQPGEHRYVTYFKQKPKAYFRKDNRIEKLEKCFGESSSVTLNIEGKEPFNIKYDIVSPDQTIQNYILENVMDSKLRINTPQFNKGGEYVLILRDVQDSSDCEVEFKGQEVRINVKNEVPKLSFLQDETFEIVRGSSHVIPLKIESNHPIDLEYVYTSLDGTSTKHFELKRYDPSCGLSVSKDGTYKLLNFKQDGCPGTIDLDYQIQLKYLPFPTIEIEQSDSLTQITNSNFEKDSICLTGESYTEFSLSGTAPFIVEYEITYPNGRREMKSSQVSSSKFSIDFDTLNDGLHTYTIQSVYDSTYTQTIIDRLKYLNEYSMNPIIITHEVSSLPSAKFLEKDIKIQACISSLQKLDKLAPINVLIDGKLPASLKVDIYHESDGSRETLELTNIQTSVVDLLTIYEYIGIGSHVVSINQVVDANKCVSPEIDSLSESITIQVNDIPKMRHLVEDAKQLSDINTESNYYCVGDQISYMLNGVPPFHIVYEFNSALQEVDIHTNYFKRRAPGPGDLFIKSLSDSAAKDCTAEFGESRRDLKATIYDLPSVEIVQGDSIEEDIQEGEQIEIIFILTGTPPFKLTYIRKELDDNSKIVETETVEDIQSNEYRILANLEGTYEAIEIQDRYCAARNHKI